MRIAFFHTAGRKSKNQAVQTGALGDKSDREPFLRPVHVEALTAAGEQDDALAARARARAHLLATANRIGDPELRRSCLEDVAENARTLRLAEERLRSVSAEEPRRPDAAGRSSRLVALGGSVPA